MLIRISLILAILAALGAGVVNFVFVKDKITTLTADRNTQRDGWNSTKDELDKTQKNLARTQNNLAQTQQQLTDANSQRDQAVATAAAQTKRADDLSDKLARTTQDRDDAQNSLAAYTATGVKAEDVAKLTRQLKDSQDAIMVANEEKMVLIRTITRLTNELAKITGTEDYVVKLRPDLRGKILVVDPKWDFVVLDIGENQGVLEDGELLVSRDGKLVAKVVVRTIEKDRCIANIVPGWKLGEVFEGDEVSPAHPST
jgi:multidrug efflux pump subunit AcrA (membrane-fusion protein)